MNEYFDHVSKIGQDVISLRDFSGVPKGTHGTVVEYYKAGKHQYGVMIQWHRYEGDTLKDGFSKTKYEDFLKEVS